MPTTPGATPERARLLQQRYRRILIFAARVLAQSWWFELFLPSIGLGRLSARGRIKRLKRVARRFRVLAAELGGLMIKVGQFLSSRLDVLPVEITRELEGLQDEVDPEPFTAITEQLERELGLPLASAFAAFEETPIAAASLGQAHLATLSPALAERYGLSDVVVKVLRPGIQEIVEVDLSALRKVAGWLSRVKLVSRRADAPALIEEFAATSYEEIDYLNEAKNLTRFQTNFADDPYVATPSVVWDRSSKLVPTLRMISSNTQRMVITVGPASMTEPCTSTVCNLPPGVSADSMTTTSTPRCANNKALTKPPMPAPTMTTRASDMVGLRQLARPVVENAIFPHAVHVEQLHAHKQRL
ncbi:MAG: hypothetical protein RLZ69_730 [Actinomycetota bacterium]